MQDIFLTILFFIVYTDTKACLKNETAASADAAELLFRISQHFFQFIHKRVDVLKLAVYRRKTDIRHRVKILELIHDQLPDDAAADLLLTTVQDIRLHLVHQILDAVGVDRSLVACPEHPRLDL